MGYANHLKPTSSLVEEGIKRFVTKCLCKEIFLPKLQGVPKFHMVSMRFQPPSVDVKFYPGPRARAIYNSAYETGHQNMRPTTMGLGQCSRLKPPYEFHFEGLSNFSASIEGLVRIQDVNPRI
jgi:hypothetical protein